MKTKLRMLFNKAFRFEDQELLHSKIRMLEHDNRELIEANIGLRLKLKKKNQEKIKVVFICHRPAIWSSIEPIYMALKNDEEFEPIIVAIPVKKEIPRLGFKHDVYESEGAEEFWREYGCINGYNYDNKEWFDIRTLEPDYVFYQQPYNVIFNDNYKSQAVSKYARILYVHYATNFIGSGVLEETTPSDFMQNVYAYFTQNKFDDSMIKNVLLFQENYFTKVFLTGFPRNDLIRNYEVKGNSNWKYSRTEERYRVLWTPRWCTNEGNSTFLDYKDSMIKYFNKNKNFYFVFRPHPQAFKSMIANGEMTEEEVLNLKQCFSESNNMSVDESPEYFNTCFSSDCLITDISSFVSDYFFTGKPIVYCHKKDCFNDFSRKMAEGFYWVHSWDELTKVVEMLRNGEDPLKSKRHELLKNLYPENNSNASMKIKKIIIRESYV